MTDAIETSEAQEFSLADIAGVDAANVTEVRFESLPAGVYGFVGVEAKLEEGTNAKEERRIIMTTVYEVTEVKSVLDRDYKSEEAKEKLIGKKHTEKQYIVPEKALEGLGLIRTWIKDLGLPNEGPFGGVEGMPEGIIDSIVGHEFTAKIIQRPRKDDPTQKSSNMRLEKAKD